MPHNRAGANFPSPFCQRQGNERTPFLPRSRPHEGSPAPGHPLGRCLQTATTQKTSVTTPSHSPRSEDQVTPSCAVRVKNTGSSLSWISNRSTIPLSLGSAVKDSVIVCPWRRQRETRSLGFVQLVAEVFRIRLEVAQAEGEAISARVEGQALEDRLFETVATVISILVPEESTAPGMTDESPGPRHSASGRRRHPSSRPFDRRVSPRWTQARSPDEGLGMLLFRFLEIFHESRDWWRGRGRTLAQSTLNG